MKDKILQEAKEWYESQKENPDIGDFVDLVIDKTTDSVFDKVKLELENEFAIGNLKHPFFISSEYYLELKLKDIKDKCKRSINNDISSSE
ncbi:MAG: hypothetical protein U9R21_03700 [Candidatus Thermoplasmatota archaeon]|nr:hypothetical protein [Candidatus Thermoplasmatota archaeon]